LLEVMSLEKLLKQNMTVFTSLRPLLNGAEQDGVLRTCGGLFHADLWRPALVRPPGFPFHVNSQSKTVLQTRPSLAMRLRL
jgi:hypothetical protein